MKIIVVTTFAILVVITSSAKLPFHRTADESTTSTTTTTTTEEPREIVPIIKDERTGPLHGNFKFDFETGDGIERTEQGYSQGIRTGVIRYPMPNGETFELRFKAGPNGFQPESDFLPKAPVFPHPIPEHAKEQLRRHGK